MAKAGDDQAGRWPRGWRLRRATEEGAARAFDDLQAQLAANRAKFYYDLPAGPFYGFNRPGVKTIEPLIWNWWRQGMMGGAKAGYDGIVAFSQPTSRKT